MKKFINSKISNRIIILFIVFLISPILRTAQSQKIDSTIFFQEFFEDLDFTSREWYDNTNMYLSDIEHIQGSKNSIEFHFKQGATKPNSGGAIRHKFDETEAIYISFWVKYSSNWQGSNRAYHPHEFLIMTNENGDWNGPAYTHLTVYVEHNEGVPLLAIQDAQNIDESNIGIDLTDSTEDRAVSGCNGDSDGYGLGSCYSVGSVHRNGKQWKAEKMYFVDTQNKYYKNDWHFIESYVKLNSFSNGKGIADGIMQYWYDGELIINYNDIMMRTGIHQTMKFNQFMIAPWIGDGSPIAQTMWVDNLTVANYRVTENTKVLPSTYKNSDMVVLQQNYPNPFNSNTTITYYLTNYSNVDLTIYDVLGNKITTIVSEKQVAGNYEYKWNAGTYSNNTYYYKLKVDENFYIRKMILVR